MPPKSEKSPDNDEAFMFVNEDFQTLFGGARKSNIDRSKQSHVQRQSFARRKRGSRKKIEGDTASPSSKESDKSRPRPSGGRASLRSSSESRTSYVPLPSTENLWLPTLHDQEELQFQSSALPPSNLSPWSSLIPPSMSQDWFGRPLPQRSHSDVAVQGTTRYFATDPRETFGLTMSPTTAASHAEISSPIPALDPFSNMQVALELWVPPLMRYYTTNLLLEHYNLELKLVSLHAMRHAESLHADMRSCMANPSEMYALLTASAYHWMNRQGRIALPGVGADDSERAALLLKSKALEALRIRLASGNMSQGSVMAIQKLQWAMVVTGNTPLADTHCTAAISMIERLGGLASFNDLQKEQIIQTCLYICLMDNRKPNLGLIWDPGSLGEVMESGIYKSTLHRSGGATGQQISDALQRTGIQLPVCTADAIPQLIEAQQVLDWLRTQPYLAEGYGWLTQRRLTLLHRLLSGLLPMQVQSDSISNPENLVALATISYMVLARTVPFPQTSLAEKYVLPALKGRTGTPFQPAFSSSTELLLWVTVMFGVALSYIQDQTPQAEGFETVQTEITELGTNACLELGITTEIELRGMLKGFLFDGDIVDEHYFHWIAYGLGLGTEPL